jgi:hypothetical protein
LLPNSDSRIRRRQQGPAVPGSTSSLGLYFVVAINLPLTAGTRCAEAERSDHIFCTLGSN